MKEILGIITQLFAVIGGIVAAIIFIRKGWKAHVNKRNSFYQGNWDNQGQISVVPSHYVDIAGHAHGNKFKGRFNVRKETMKMAGKCLRSAGEDILES